MRFNSDGTPDAGFGSGGIVVSNFGNEGVNALAIQPDGKILVGGSRYEAAVFRFLASGNVGIEEASVGENPLTIYPNPFSTSATLIMPAHLRGNEVLKIYTASGQLTQQINLTSDYCTIDRSGLCDGIYFYQLLDDDGVLGVGRFIVH